jgi:hypothetical protein
VEFLTPKFQSAELVCMDAPRGQLPADASNGAVSKRIIGIDESGEDCRQRLARVKMKVEVFEEVVAEMNPKPKTQKDKK